MVAVIVSWPKWLGWNGGFRDPPAVSFIVAGFVALAIRQQIHERKRVHEWPRYQGFFSSRMLRKKPDGSWEYRDETPAEEKEDQENNAW
jgi:hypothetical protein